MNRSEVDEALSEWGSRLFFGQRNYSRRAAGSDPMAALAAIHIANQARAVRARIAQLTRPGARQVMVKITGGGRGMKSIAAHLSYISKHGRLALENERGERVEGKEALRDLQAEWRIGGSYLPDVSHRREAYHLMFSMPRGTPAEAVLDAVRALGKDQFANHAYAMVLHDHQAHPHVHLAVKAEGFDGRRLNPRKQHLRTYRELFARELQARGIEAVATPQPVHGASRAHPPRWRVAAAADARERRPRPAARTTVRSVRSRLDAFEAWGRVHDALAASPSVEDRELAAKVGQWLTSSRDVAETRSIVGARRGSAGRERDTPGSDRSH
jgi:hypothetical protein